MGDPLQIALIFHHLIDNARDSIERSGRPGLIEIRTSDEDGKIKVEVFDSGDGCPEGFQLPPMPEVPDSGTEEGYGFGLNVVAGDYAPKGRYPWLPPLQPPSGLPSRSCSMGCVHDLHHDFFGVSRDWRVGQPRLPMCAVLFTRGKSADGNLVECRLHLGPEGKLTMYFLRRRNYGVVPLIPPGSGAPARVRPPLPGLCRVPAVLPLCTTSLLLQGYQEWPGAI